MALCCIADWHSARRQIGQKQSDFVTFAECHSAKRQIDTLRYTAGVARAAWWFAQMREVVERAMDWNAGGEPRPEQIWIPGATREVKV